MCAIIHLLNALKASKGLALGIASGLRGIEKLPQSAPRPSFCFGFTVDSS